MNKYKGENESSEKNIEAENAFVGNDEEHKSEENEEEQKNEEVDC